MAWYYYSGKTPRSITVRKGLSVAVRPHTKVEIFEITPDSQALIRKGQLKRTSKPKGVAPTLILDQELKIEDVVPKSAMAMRVAEKGVTESAKKPPKKPKGKPEMTVDELEVMVSEKSKAEDRDTKSESAESVDVLSDAEKAAPVARKKKKVKRGRRKADK